MKENYPNSVSSLLTLFRLTKKRSIVLFLYLIFFISNPLKAQIALRGTATTSTSTNTNITINKPTGVITGDLMLVNIAKGGNRTTAPSLAGWTLIDGVNLGGGGATQRYGAVLYKVATAGEPVNYTFALGAGTNSASGGIIAFSGVDATTPFDVTPGTISVQVSQTGVVATSITTVTANTAIVMFGQAAGNNPTWNNGNWNSTSPGALTELFDVNQGTGDRSSAGAAWAAKPTIGATGNGAATLSTAERNGGILLALRQACSNSVAPTSISGTTTICNGNSTTLTVNGGTVASGATIQWFTGSCGGTSAGTGNSITVSPSTNTTYFVRYSGTCNTTSCVSATVTVNSTSVAPTSITGTTSICAGNSRTLTLSGGTEGTGAIAEWFSGSCGGTSAGTGNSITVSPLVNTTYFVRYSGTCNTTTCASVTVSINSASTAPTSITGIATVCNGSSTTLTLSGGSAGTGATAQWFSGSCGGTSAGTGNSITVSPSNNTPYFVRYSGTCNTTSCATITVAVLAVSTAPTSIIGSNTICEGNATTLVASGGFIGTGGTTQWFSGSCGGVSAGSGNSITVSPSSTTTYFVRYSGTCNDTSCASSTVTVNTFSTAPTSISGSTTICNGSSTTLTVGGGTIGTGSTVEWFTDSCGGTPAGSGNSITVSPATTTTYFVRYTGPCNTTTCTSVTVTVNSLSIAPTNISGTTTICSGDSTTLTFNGGFAGTGATEEWFSGSCGGTYLGTGNSINVSPIATTNYFVRYNGTCNTTTCASVSVLVDTPHAITLQPSDNQTVCSDSSVTFTVGATGTVSSYQWYNGATLLVDGGSISGAATANLTLNPVSTADASSNYYCVVSGPCAAPISSNTATLVVNEKVTITTQPQPSQSFCTGSTATFTIAATGTGLTYQWYKGAVLLVDGGSISGATSSTLSISSLTVGDAANNYYCIVSGTSPCSNITSNNAALIVNTFAAITIQPSATQTICADLFVNFFITATGSNLNYQWFKGATMLIDGGPITGATTSTLTINPIALSDAASDYHCVVSNVCTPGLSSNNAALIVNETPLIPDQTLSICSDDTFTLNLINGVPTAATVVPTNTTYTWPSPILTGGMTGGIAGNNETGISQTLTNPTNTPQTAIYFITPTSGNTGTCIGPDFALFVTVNPKPSINNITAAFCSEQSFSFTPANGGGNIVPVGTKYSWGIPTVTGGMTGGSAGSGQTSIAQTLTNPTNSDKTASYTVTATSGVCPPSTFSVDVTIHPKPTIAASVPSQSACSGTAITPILLSNPNGIAGTIDYSWTRDNTTNTTGISSSGNTATIAGNLTNTTTSPQTTVFTLVATSDDNCISNAATASVIVNPVPTVSAAPASQTTCSENAITPITITNPNSILGTTFSWTRTNTTNLTGIAASGTSTSISGILTNTTNIVQTTTFTITASANGCDTTINTISITVNPKPTILALPLTQTLCGSAPFASITISNPNSVAGTTYTWTRNNVVNTTGIAASGIGSTISGTFQNNTNSTQTVTFTITATAGTCASNTTTVDIVLLPTPLITISPNAQTICHLQAITTIAIGNSNAVTGTTYSWTRNNTTNLTGIASSGSGNSITGTFSNNTTSIQTTTFTITATAPNGCSSSSTATVTVYAPLVAPTISAPQTVCVLSNPSLLTITTPASGGSGVYTYQWQSSTNNVTYNNIAGATNNTYQPPFVNLATVNTYYRLITTNICGSVTSNVIFVEVVSNIGFSFGFNSNLAGPICSGSSFTPDINSVHFSTSAVRFSWTADPTYITPAAGGPIGTTGAAFLGFRTSSAIIGPLTAVNNTNATIVTSVSINPSVYNFPGPPSGAFICSTSPQIFNVTIRPIPVATATGNNTTVCNVSGPGIVVSGNITDATMSYAWTRNNTINVTGTNSGNSGNIAAGGTFSLNPTLTNTTAVSQIVQFTITPSSNGCVGSPIVISITVAPTVTAGTIAANQTICNGADPAAFTQTTAATGVNLSYQWQSSTDNLSYSNISSATSSTFDSGTLTQTTWFRRVVTSTVNGTSCSATSAAISVTVNAINPGSIAGNQTVCGSGNPSSFTSVAATGSGTISYQWQSNTTGCGGSWANILGATNPTYDIPVGLAVTTYYRRVATSTLSSVACSDFSNCITVFVNTVTGGTVGSDQTLCGNNPTAFAELTAASAAGTISYQWQNSTTGCAGPWSIIVGATSATYDAPAGVLVTTYYQRVTTSTLNSVACTATSNCVTVSVNPVTAGTISGNRTICSGGDPAAFTQTTAATGLNLTYEWQISTTTSAGPWTDISGVITAFYDAPGPITQTTYYRRIAIATVNSTSCTATSNFVTVFVNSVTPSTVAGDQSICGAFDDPAAFTVTTAATGNGTLSYQWQSNTTGCGGAWANIAGATSATYDAPNVLLTTYYRVVITSTLNSVQCTAISNCLTITSFSKTWNGNASTDWNNGLNWSPVGVPTISDCVVIPNVLNDPYILGSNYSAYAKSLSILAGAELELSSNNSITVSDAINVNATGSFDIRDNASLVQINNVPNIGRVNIERITQPMYRYDYTYWGTPVTAASNFTLGMLSPLTLLDKYFSWIPTVANSFGNWFYESAATIMNPIKGYIVRAPQTFSTNIGTKVPFTANFIGTPNNGDISCPIYFGGLPLSNNNDKYNLLGNPYASAVDAELFLSDPANVPIIDGTIYFWTHNSPPSAANVDPFYGDFIYNYAANDYASWNRLGGTGTTVAAGSGGAVPSGFIASGQGFFTKSTGTATSGDPVVFKNSMRVNFNNNQFFRNAIVGTTNSRSDENVNEKHRIWLNLVNNGGSFNQILVGYTDEATNDFDRDFDGVRFTDNNTITFYSIIPNKNLVIQGRALPFDNQDQVALGYKSTLNDTFSIRIDHFDGLFENQNIYLEDRLLNIIHDLKQSPYSFASEIGSFDDRFVLRYTTDVFLNTSEFNTSASLVASISNGNLEVKCNETMTQIDIYDISGKLIKRFELDRPEKKFGSPISWSEGVYFLKAKLKNGMVISSKLLKQQ